MQTVATRTLLYLVLPQRNDGAGMCGVSDLLICRVRRREFHGVERGAWQEAEALVDRLAMC